LRELQAAVAGAMPGDEAIEPRVLLSDRAPCYEIVR
jgi:hypothetical protein